MFRTFSKFLTATLVVAALTHSSLASAYGLSTTGTTVGGVVLVWKLLDASKEEQSPARKAAANKHAEVFIRQNSAQLGNDLALASGPIVNDLAHAMNIPAEHKGQLRKVIRENRAELSELARLDALTPERAGELFRVLAVKVQADPLLANDLGKPKQS